MALCIPNVLAGDALASLRSDVAAADFVDGRETAGHVARLVKVNEQLRPDDPRHAELHRRAVAAIAHNPTFRRATIVKAIRTIMISRYRVGMHYGRHVDAPTIGDVRSDVSFTLFLSDPATYDGGELVLEEGSGETPIKLPAGAMVVYPSGQLHRVNVVTRGERLAVVGWAQSFVRDPRQRDILFELDTVRDRLFEREGKTADHDLLSKSVMNLMRMWADA